jgi:hypothetical protein
MRPSDPIDIESELASGYQSGCRWRNDRSVLIIMVRR